ncbi:MAG: hypothetical protein JW830_09405 [Bacteroidales bacterium]|nr:hypothetical protein [Bacteroidales bacterium]
MPQYKSGNSLFYLTIFSIAMGYLESAVVVYLREIYYPSGFAFPVNPLSAKIGLTEVLRETATILMLLSVGFLGGKNLRQRFAVFLYCFAVWDIFYYVFLKVLIRWPESFLTWDLLFLIPVAWTGPVIAPLIVSATMILLACILLFSGESHRSSGRRLSRALVISGAVLVFLSFIWDFSGHMLDHYPMASLFRAADIGSAMHTYVPGRFNWWIFMAGEAVILAGIYMLYSISMKSSHK